MTPYNTPLCHAQACEMATKELTQKHLLGITAEPLDRCLHEQLITKKQHRAGLHFRWLYTIRFGKPFVSAYQPSEMMTALKKKERSTLWQQKREQEYHTCLCLLRQTKSEQIIRDICIYQQLPGTSPHQLTAKNREKLIEGLETLALFFTQQRKQRQTKPKTMRLRQHLMHELRQLTSQECHHE